MIKPGIRQNRLSISKRLRRFVIIEQLERRDLLSADAGNACDAYFANGANFVSAQSSIVSGQSGNLQSMGLGTSTTADLTRSQSSSPQTLNSAMLVSSNSSGTIASSSSSRGSLLATAVDDAFENNDTFYQAAPLGDAGPSTANIDLVMADRADWFQFQLNRPGDTTSKVSIQFQSSLGDLDLAVYNANARLVGYSNGTTNSESVSLAGLSAGTYYVFVYGYRNATNPHYTLSIKPGQSITDDRFEPNNSPGHAADLGAPTSTLTEQNLVMADAGDWYRFNLTNSGTSSSKVAINFQHSAGDLDMEVFNRYGQLVGRSEGVSNSENVSLAGLSAGTYYVYIYGYRGAHNPAYSLTVNPGVSNSNPTPPVPNPTPTPTPTTPGNGGNPTTPPSTSGFQIDLNMTGLTASEQAIFRQATQRWSQVILGDLPNMVYNGVTVDDLLIDVSATSIDGAGGVLGQASPDRFRPGSQIPYHGSMQFDSADIAQMQANGTLLGVIEHEIGHVLGIGTIWQNLGLLVGANTNNPIFVGTQATAEYDAEFGVQANGVPVENTGGPGTAGGHWRESVFGNELMTGYVGPGLNLPLSRITIASLADLGYQVNMNAADPYPTA